MRSALNLIFVSAIEDDLCYKNPVNKNIKLQSAVPPAQKQAYTQTEYDTVWKFARSHPYGLAIMVLMETGISRSELLGLRWENLDLHNKIIYTEQGLVEQKSTETDRYVLVSDGLKNGFRRRPIPISAELANALRDKPRAVYVGGNRKKGVEPKLIETDFVFHAPNGGAFSPQNWDKREYFAFMRDLLEKYPQIKTLSPHELRHTRATLAANSGVDLLQLAKLLGHSDLTMLVKRYAHTDVDALRKALKIDDSDG